MFEKLERLDELLTQHQWNWVLRWPVPWHSVGRLLTILAELPAHADTDRAWRQVDVIFQRHNNDEFSTAQIPAWRVVERLCDQAMLVHSSRVHIGYSYAERLPGNTMHPTEASFSVPVDTSSSMAEALFGDVDMLQHLSEGSHMPSL